METIMNDREAMRRETRNLRREVHESQQFADKLQKEKRDLSNEMDHLIRSRSEIDSNQNSNNQDRISLSRGDSLTQLSAYQEVGVIMLTRIGGI